MPAIDKLCAWCEVEFTTHPCAPHQVYCSQKCFRKKDRAKNEDRIREEKKKWRESNIEEVKSKARVYYEENKEKIKARTKKWNQENKQRSNELKRRSYAKRKLDPTFLEKRRENSRKAYLKKKGDNPDWWRDRYQTDEDYKLKVSARRLARAAFKEGVIHREDCVKCGKWAEMHHEDYSKPLEIMWLCRKCHKEHHRTHPKI